MTRIGIVGAGTAARLHAEATILARGVELVGVGGGATRGAALGAELGIPDLSFDELLQQTDALVLAVPGHQTEAIISKIGGAVDAVLLESPHRVLLEGPALSQAHLLHAPATAPALRAIAAMDRPHHLVLRARRPGDAGMEARRLAPLLFAAAGTTVVDITSAGAPSAEAVALRLRLTDGRVAHLDVHGHSSAATIELEAADTGGVTSVRWEPSPTLEVDGEQIDLGDAGHPLVELGYVGQMARLGAVARGRAEAWPTATSGATIDALVESALSPTDGADQPSSG